jgi:ribosomal protein S20
MSISPVSSGNQSTSSMPTKMSQIRQDFKALQDSLNSGDLEGAQKAFAAVEQDLEKFQQGNRKAGSTAQLNQAQQDWQALQSALSSGDVDGAKQALAAFKQDLGKAHGRHHHRKDNDSDATSGNTGTDPSTTGTTGTDSSAPDSTSSTGSPGSSASITLTLSLTLISVSGTTSTTNPTGSLVNLTA